MMLTRLRHAPRWFFNALIMLLVLLVLALLLARHAVSSPVDCRQLAEVVSAVADFRDTRADITLVIRMAKERSGVPPAILEREIRRVWKEGLSADDAALSAYRRCTSQMGEMREQDS